MYVRFSVNAIFIIFKYPPRIREIACGYFGGYVTDLL